MIEIAGYDIHEKIFAGSHSRIFRACRTGDNLNVILKIPASDALSIRENLRFQHEYRLLSSLNLNRVIKVLDLLQYRSGFVIVEEDYGACDLAMFLEDKSISGSDFFPWRCRWQKDLPNFTTAE